MDKIIFLDIDGPVIPGRVYDSAFCSDLRSRFAKDSIEHLNTICDRTGAKIVTNSMQNYLIPMGTDLREDLIKWGLTPSHLHEEWRTAFPYVDYASDPNPRRGWGRWLGIKDWMEFNGIVNWICFDDRNWTDNPRLILINFNRGITEVEREAALDLFETMGDENLFLSSAM